MTRPTNAPRASGLLRRLFQLTGDDPATLLDDTLYTALELEAGILVRPEHAYARGERLCGAAQTQVAVAGQTSAVGVLNPAGSGVIATVVGCSIRVAAALDVLGGVGLHTVGVISQPGALLDTRYWGPDPAAAPRSVCGLFNATAAVLLLPRTFAQARKGGATMPTSELMMPPIVLRPGSGMEWRTTAVNTELAMAYWWLEREAERSERGGP